MRYTSNETVRRRSRRARMLRRRRRRQRVTAALLIIIALFAGAGVTAGTFIADQLRGYTAEYEYEQYNSGLWQGSMFATELCVAAEDRTLEGYEPDPELHAAGLFSVGGKEVVCGYRMFDQLYPASTTKVMTAYVTLKYGNLEDIVTVSENAVDFNWDETTCGLKAGDKVTLYDLLCGLMLHSGNDCGAAIAEHISGSTEAFAELMNQEALSLGATGTHFVNPHGLHDADHYTTAYDLYLIFNASMKDQRFVDIISMDSYTGTLTGADGTVRTETWEPTNFYCSGRHTAPEGITVLGGKTGTTNEAGNCLIIYAQNSAGEPYISVVMGAPDRTVLYEQMDQMMTLGMAQ